MKRPTGKTKSGVVMMTRQVLVASDVLPEVSQETAAPAYGLSFEWFDIDRRPSEWDAQVRAVDQGLFHLSHMLSAHAFGRARRRGIVVRCGSGVAAVLGGLWYRDAHGEHFQTLSFPAPTGERLARLLPELLDWLRQQGVVGIRIGSFESGVENYPLGDGAWSIEERLEFPWRLDQDESERMRALRSNHKRKLKSLLKRELRVREIQRFQAEHMTWLRLRWAHRRGRRLGLRELFGLYRYYSMLQTNLTRPGLAKLYGLYDQENCLLTMAYMLESGSAAFYMIGASSMAGYRIGASVRLFWDLAGMYAERGLGVLNLGGVPKAALDESHDEHGTFRFKADFGIEPVRRATLVYHKPREQIQEAGRASTAALALRV